MGFFQNSVLNKHLKALDKAVVNDAYTKFKECFHNPEIQHNIREAKEEQFQEGFLRELFVKVLGYTLNPQPNYNLTTELKNEKGANKADGAILKEGKAIAVIELKGTDTKDLDKINTQAFNYKNNQTGCIYVITSNFEKLRFFIHNSVDHLEFNLFTLTEQEFELLWLCLNVDCLLGGIPLKVKEESLLAEENVTKQLYKDYAAFRIDLWQNMVKNRPDVDQSLLFKKTQKLLDRFLFIFFAEDSGLLPPNSISRIVERWGILGEEDAYKPLYDIFNQYFGYINTGRKGKIPQDDIFAYNGGLFFPDEVLDNIVIDDDVLQPHVMKLTNYDFQSEIDVNILGHIFENSLSEIENVIAKLEGKEVDKNKTKRKKERVFYTPKYITKYIVDNTIGKLCEEKKAELGIIDEEYAKGRRNRKKETIKKLDKGLQAYQKWLLNITICDPACGSGAFLNQALEYLIAEHTYIDELQAHLLGRSIVFHDVSNHILEKNIYGVDINEESVDIAKLSLWLRTAQKGRELTTLNNNLKCGDSLIDDPEVAGGKAFNWQKEFPEIFDKGGFDVVIGNPPYVQSLVNDLEKKYYHKHYKSDEGKPDLYRFFIEKGITLINDYGKFSFITPNSFLTIPSAKKLRAFIKEKASLVRVINFEGMVFEDANINTVIFVIDKSELKNKVVLINDKEPTPTAISLSMAVYNSVLLEYDQYHLNDEINIGFVDKDTDTLLEKIKGAKFILADISKYTLGLQVYHNTIHTKEEIKSRIYHSDIKVDSSYIPEIGGKNLDRYNIELDKFEYVSLGDWCYNKPDDYFLTGERLFIREIPSASHLISALFSGLGVPNKAVIIVKSDSYSMKSLIGIINSKLIGSFIHKTTEKGKQKLFPRISLTSVRNIPIPEKPDVSFENLVKSHIKYINDFKKHSSIFMDLMNSKFCLLKLNNKLKNWHELEFGEFLKELEIGRKAVAKENGIDYIKLSLSEEAEWMQYFNEQKQKALELKAEIDRIDNEIDQMVYELYGLTDKEIKIIEQSI